MLPDQYPTRLERRMSMFYRRDPVVHGNIATARSGPLKQHHLEQYKKEGFLWFENLFSDTAIMDNLLKEFSDLEKDQSIVKSEQAICDSNSGSLRSVFGIHELSEEFARLTVSDLILGMVRQLLGSDVYIHQSRINAKPGFVGGGFNWHSDFETWHAEDGMPSMRAVSASLLLSDNNEFNGPLMLIPGSHRYHVPCQGVTPDENWKRSLKSQQVGVPDTASLKRLINKSDIVAPKGGAGSLLLFECNTLHASQRNLSPWPRANAFFVFNSVENALEKPYAGTRPRPDYLAARETTTGLSQVHHAQQVAM